ncbi:glycosyltransferase family 2 protein [Phenylobacterium sp.]|uniref:polysaccharide biosynthesis protein HfsG n=1 Tax=Phenylobacterium sp. TaxID=1871053 RepID=UPI002734E990|nr:glycosyltransferase family A protein [Phenylobacterium sp.]MDP3634385.1 glycosyltransferase family A protein [Phenylobacterium sp.]
MTEALFDNPLWLKGRPALSILTPFKGDDPTPLLAALARESANAELVILDDGSNDPELAARVETAVAALPFPARFIRLAKNEGRSKGRNRLVSHARASHYLFLDSDMLPDTPTFIATWLSLIAAENPAVAFGGFSLDQAPPRPDHALHRAMAGQSDCQPAAQRALMPEKIFTSNLLVRADVFAGESFDEGFAGWGWEDVEWGMRVAGRWPILHVENTATHLGLDTASTLADKYEQSAGNFARVVASHHAAISRYPSYKVARVLKRAPLRKLWRPMLKAYALTEAAPIRSRAFAMRLYRAALYAEAV